MIIPGFIVDRPEILNQPALTQIFITGVQIQVLPITEVELPEAITPTTGHLIIPHEVVVQLEVLLLHEAQEQQEVPEALAEAVVVEDNFETKIETNHNLTGSVL